MYSFPAVVPGEPPHQPVARVPRLHVHELGQFRLADRPVDLRVVGSDAMTGA
jgi:hypothetical protein